MARTVYLGTSDFAAAILDRLADSPHRPQLVVTRPDRPAGRGRRLSAPPVADAARALGLELLQPQSVNDPETFDAIAAARPDVVVVCAFGALIREPLLSGFAMRNVHPSLLPRWRGAAPVERALMEGDAQTGVCVIGLTADLDSGPVFLAGAEPIAPDDTYGTLALRLRELGADLLLRVLDERPDPVAQPDDGVTYADKITPADRTLQPRAPAAVNDRIVRALSPHIGARVALPGDGDGFLGVLRAAVREPGEAGELRADGERLLLGGLELLEVQPAGGRPMDSASFLRGRGL